MAISGAPVPWYRSLNAQQWKTLAAANLGWLFDGYETYALILTVAAVLHQFLAKSQLPSLPFYAGATIGITLLGWACGGILGGVLSDYFGRKRVMIGAIIAYAALTGLTAFSWSWESFAILRFCVGLALGSEWGTGTAMMAEMWPDNARGKGAGLMQCGLGLGFFVASAIWLYVGGLGPGAWRWMFVLGILPAFATLWIRRGIAEPEKWLEADRARRAAIAAKKAGTDTAASDELTKFTLAQLFEPRYAKLTIVALLMSLTTTVGWWGISTWVPPYVASLAVEHGLNPSQWSAIGGIAYNIGGVAGYALFGFFADAFGRRVVTAAYFALALVLTPVLFIYAHGSPLPLVLILCAVNAFFTNGQYTWMPVWLPEVYPTRIRATAISFVFNSPRFVAFLGPLVAGSLIVRLGGYGIAATAVGSIYLLGLVAAPFFPETRGKPLPET